MSANRRRSERIRAAIKVTVRVGRKEIPTTTLDINLRGLFLLTREQLPVEQLVRLTIHLPDGDPTPIACFGWVRFSDPERAGGAGLQFFALGKANEDRWTQFYQALRSRRPQPVRQRLAAAAI